MTREQPVYGNEEAKWGECTSVCRTSRRGLSWLCCPSIGVVAGSNSSWTRRVLIALGPLGRRPSPYRCLHNANREKRAAESGPGEHC